MYFNDMHEVYVVDEPSGSKLVSRSLSGKAKMVAGTCLGFPHLSLQCEALIDLALISTL